MAKQNNEIDATESHDAAASVETKAKRARNVRVTFSEETVERVIRVPTSMTIKTDAGETIVELGSNPDATLAFCVAHGAKARAGDSFASVTKLVADGANREETLSRISGEVADDFNSGDFSVTRGGNGGGLTRQSFAMTYLGNAYAAKGHSFTQKQLKEKVTAFLANDESDPRIGRFNAAYEVAKNAGQDIDIDI